MKAGLGIMPGIGGDMDMFIEDIEIPLWFEIGGVVEECADVAEGEMGVGVKEFIGTGEVLKAPKLFKKSLSIFCNLNLFLRLRKEPFSNMVSAFG
jgi:hypothetical protein